MHQDRTLRFSRQTILPQVGPAGQERLAHIDSELALNAHVTDLDADNIERLLAGADVVVDATDNFETRYLINDWALFAEVPWIYGGVIGTEGLCLPVVPRRTEDLARARGLYDRYVGS